jgi:hypothetical protein
VYSPTTGGGTAVAWLGGGYAIAMNGAGSLPYEVHLLFTDASGTALGAPARVAQAGDNSVMPSIAWNGAELGVAWTDMRSGTPGVYFARFAKDGSRLADDLLLSDGAVRASFPSLSAQGGGGWVACYQEKVAENNQDIFCTRLDAGGAATQTARLTNAVGNTTNAQALAHGRYTWVLWDDDASGTTVIAWQFLDATGTPILDQPNTSDISAWRAHGAVTDDALYFADYHTDTGATWVAEGATLNCF